MTRPVNINRRHEVVHVFTPAFLVNSARLACRYETPDGRLLALGHYLALWPGGRCHATYDCEVRYFGPFATQTEAQFLQTGAAALGIAETAAPIPVPAKQGSGFGQDRISRSKIPGILPAQIFAW